MNFRITLVAAVSSALLGFARADDDENGTNVTTGAPTSAPTTPGSTSLAAGVGPGVSCLNVLDDSGINVGTKISLGPDTIKDTYYVTAVYDKPFCPAIVGDLRRLTITATTKSIKIQPATTRYYDEGTTVMVVSSNPTPPTPPGSTYTLTATVAGQTCLPVFNVEGFKGNDAIQIGTTAENSEIRYIVTVYQNSLCGKDLTFARRLGNDVAGSFQLDAGGLALSYAKNTQVKTVTVPSGGSTCFPGDATVDVYGRGATQMASLSVGDRVLVENGEFEPVLSFLHKVPGVAQALTLVHSQGTLQASENHIVFTSRGDMPVSALRPGDDLLMQSGPSPILAIGQGTTASGMYAPFTASGALVVDGVAVSNYGTPTSKSSLPHAAAHAAFFALRVYYYLDFAMVAKVLCSLAMVMMVPRKL